MSLIAYLTDFGLVDPYVGQMKAAAWRIFPGVDQVDISHEVRPFDIRHGAFLLWATHVQFPVGTVFCAVVDPGVGTSRELLIAEADGCYYVGPDNGLFGWLRPDFPLGTVSLAGFSAHQLLPQILHGEPSSTFHGRDIFAPIAAALARGDMSNLLVRKPINPQPCPGLWPEVTADRITGAILHVDRFGNLVTNIPAGLLGEYRDEVSIRAGNTTIRGVHETFADVGPETPLAYIGSNGFLEIAVNQGHAGTELGVSTRHPIVVRL